MNYSLLKKIKDVQHYYEFDNSNLLYVNKQNILKCITKYDFKEMWNINDIYNFFINRNCVIAGKVGNEKNLLLNLKDGSIIKKFEFDLNIMGKRTENYYYGSMRKNDISIILKYDLQNNELAGIYNSMRGIRTIVDDNFYLGVQEMKVINKIAIDNAKALWQFDITQFGSYMQKSIFANGKPEEKQRKINRVYFHHNKIIITLSRAVIALDPENGQLLWKIDFAEYNPMDVVFNEHVGYIGEGLDYAVIDIEKGIKIFEKIFNPKEQVDIEGIKLSHILYIGLIWHDGFIWFTHGRSSKQFLFKAKPENGDIVDGMLLETKAPSTHPPIFDENRMYILDQDGVLYIYEKQN